MAPVQCFDARVGGEYLIKCAERLPLCAIGWAVDKAVSVVPADGYERLRRMPREGTDLGVSTAVTWNEEHRSSPAWPLATEVPDAYLRSSVIGEEAPGRIEGYA